MQQCISAFDFRCEGQTFFRKVGGQDRGSNVQRAKAGWTTAEGSRKGVTDGLLQARAFDPDKTRDNTVSIDCLLLARD